MEFLNKIIAFFTSLTRGFERLMTRLFGSSNERQIAKLGYKRDKDGVATITPGSVLDRINKFEPAFEKLSADELKESAAKFRARIANGETLDELLPEAFAAVRESSKRYLKMRHYDVQMVGGYFLHNGAIAEMVTGEGKTLVSTLPAFLNALTGHVHVVTVNDYLAVRDMEWMGPVHIGLGLTVGAIESNLEPPERQVAYACDITYGTNNEFGFDYLRDNMKPTKEMQAQGELHFAIIDEVDNILIDEARTPLIISGPAQDDVAKYGKADRVTKQLQKDVHFEVQEKEHSCHLTDAGIRKAEELAGVESFFTAGNMEWPHLIDNSLRAYYLYKRDVSYVVEGGKIVIVDEFTGRKMEGRQWSDGLHQAIEAKEGVTIEKENQTLATITLQNFFKLYGKLSGMTGTAMTEAGEFWKVYKLDVISVPTNRPLRRVNSTDAIFRTEQEKWNAVLGEVREVHPTGRPILIGTVSIEKSELIGKQLSKHGIKHEILNAKYHEREAEIIAQAGRKSAVTIATNMAGRGTDIILGGNPEHMAWEELKQTYDSRLQVTKDEWDATTDRIAEQEGMTVEGREVAELGGLHVIGTERHDSRRIDLQLRGRAGRQGDPGSSRFMLSLEDDLMRLFAGEWVKNMLTRLGMEEGQAIESKMVMGRVEGAQKKVEERHFDQRKHLLDYDEVMDDQRTRVYSYRQDILDGTDCRQLILEMIEQQIRDGSAEYFHRDYRWEMVVQWAESELGVPISVSDVNNASYEQLVILLKDLSLQQAETLIHEQIETDLPEAAEDQTEWNWLALSKWVNARWDLNTNDRELKKIGRDHLFDELRDRAVAAVDRVDFSPLKVTFEDDFAVRSMCGWLHQQFALELMPEQFPTDANDPEGEANQLILEQVHELYERKETEFPISVGLHKFLSDRSVSEKQGRERLLRWVNERFDTELTVEQFRGNTRDELEAELFQISRRFRQQLSLETFREQLEAALDKAYGVSLQNGMSPQNGQPLQNNQASSEAAVHNNGTAETHSELNGNLHANGSYGSGVDETAVAELAHWINETLHAEWELDDVKSLSRIEIQQRASGEYQRRYRPELNQAERSLLLEIVDTAWKDHLYSMDHLRASIGLVGYAQKDPKTEYKREGRKTFQAMWERIGQQTTSAIFRIEQESPEFVGSLWEITSTDHEETNAGADYGTDAEPESNRQVNDDLPAVETIRNRGPKVGRNDPCPCGSGKKYKKCCG